LVAEIYGALASSPAWSKTLFVITYDEHGGFFDHVPPPRDTRDAAAGLGSLGVRVPALVVSPWGAPRSVSRTEYDHTSLLRTILLRFCDGASMTPRTDGAADLGPLLSAAAPRLDLPTVPAPSQPVAVAGPRDPSMFGQVLRRFVLGF
jgi:phospholipase C